MSGRTSFVDTLRAVDDAGLDVYEFRLWVHIWRVGASWESLRVIADKCGMSLGKASQAKKALMERNMLVYTEHRGRLALTAVLCSPDERCSPDEQTQHSNRSPHEQVVHHMNNDNVAIVHHMNADVHHMNTDVHHMNAILSIPLEERPLEVSNRSEREGEAAARAPIPAELQSWFDEHKIPPPRTAEEITLIRSPAGQLWLNVTMRWPGWPSLRRIVQSLGPAPDEAALRKTWGDWELNGYSPRNIAGILEKYHTEAGRAGHSRNNPPLPNGRHSAGGAAESVEQAKARFAAAMEEKWRRGLSI